MSAGDWITLVVIGALGCAWWLGRKRGREALDRALSAARAEGHAEARAQVAAELTNQVQIINGVPSGSGEVDDPLVAALRRIAADPAALARFTDRSDTGLGQLAADEHVRPAELRAGDDRGTLGMPVEVHRRTPVDRGRQLSDGASVVPRNDRGRRARGPSALELLADDPQ